MKLTIKLTGDEVPNGEVVYMMDDLPSSELGSLAKDIKNIFDKRAMPVIKSPYA